MSILKKEHNKKKLIYALEAALLKVRMDSAKADDNGRVSFKIKDIEIEVDLGEHKSKAPQLKLVSGD